MKTTMAAPKKKKVIRDVVRKVTKTKGRLRLNGSGSRLTRAPRKKLVRSKKEPPVKVRKIKPLVEKFHGNPIMEPAYNSHWESQAVFNPGAVVYGGRVHLFYRALGADGMSRIGYASSKDGIHFDERLTYPVYIAENFNDAMAHFPYTSPARFEYSLALYASGGGWGGCEDPRAVNIEGRIYLTFNMFNGWQSMRVAYTSIDEKDLLAKRWNWSKFAYLSRPGDRQKNWVLFPEKIKGKFALFYNLDKGDADRVHIAFLDELDMYKAPTQTEAPDVHTLPDHVVAWHNRTRSAAAPPIKTKDGWLLFYHAMDKDDPGKYKVGALMLDLKDPTKVLYRAARPVLEPDMWYENDWKPGIVYASGAVVKDGKLFLYYGGGDKRIAMASADLEEFIDKLKHGGRAILSKVPSVPV